MTEETTPRIHEYSPGALSPENHEFLRESGFTLQSPSEFRDDFVRAVNKAGEHDQIGFETMQFEASDYTLPIFDALADAKQRGVQDVRYHYDRVALRHVRIGGTDGEVEHQAFRNMGRTVFRGDRDLLTDALNAREKIVDDLEALGITDPANRNRHPGQRHLSHNHVKLAIVGDTVWFGTMNQRALDYRISNFMVKVTDPEWVAHIKTVFNQAEAPQTGPDQVFKKESDPYGTELLLDTGVKGQSSIYDKAVEMAESLQDGDEFVLISQWPPVKMMYGLLGEALHGKTQAGEARGTYLLSPSDKLHPTRAGSRMLQKQLNKMQQLDPNMSAIHLARMTHAKAFLIKRANGSREVLFGSHNLTSSTVRNGTRELAMWSRDPAITSQIEAFLDEVASEPAPVSPSDSRLALSGPAVISTGKPGQTPVIDASAVGEVLRMLQVSPKTTANTTILVDDMNRLATKGMAYPKRLGRIRSFRNTVARKSDGPVVRIGARVRGKVRSDEAMNRTLAHELVHVAQMDRRDAKLKVGHTAIWGLAAVGALAGNRLAGGSGTARVAAVLAGAAIGNRIGYQIAPHEVEARRIASKITTNAISSRQG